MSQEIMWESEGYRIVVTGEFDNGYLDTCVKATTDPRFKLAKYAIINFKQVKHFPIDSDFIQKIAINDVRAYSENENLKLAIVADKLVVSGLLNMYITYFELNNDNKTWSMNLFDSEDKAREWIGEQ